jgi:hypothetical protein
VALNHVCTCRTSSSDAIGRTDRLTAKLKYHNNINNTHNPVSATKYKKHNTNANINEKDSELINTRMAKEKQ